MPALFFHLAIQAGATALVALIALALPGVLTMPNPTPLLALVQGGLAALSAWLLRQPWWWRLIHLVFVPLAVAALQINLPPWLYLVAFAGLALVFWTTFRGDAPLFLSNRATAQAVLELLPPRADLAVADLGAGTGGLLRVLAQERPAGRFVGVEHAPLPYLAGRLAGRSLPNLSIEHGDLWRRPLTEFDVVYAFLAPPPMPRLWHKAIAEMRPGTLLVSNSFPVPGVAPSRVVEVPDGRRTHLYCYTL
jgi:hypothetical protein